MKQQIFLVETKEHDDSLLFGLMGWTINYNNIYICSILLNKPHLYRGKITENL